MTDYDAFSDRVRRYARVGGAMGGWRRGSPADAISGCRSTGSGVRRHLRTSITVVRKRSVATRNLDMSIVVAT